jgi:hypothetical protein
MRKTSFSTKGYAEIHIQWLFFDIEKGIWKILVLKIQTMCTCFDVPLHMEVILLKKTNISIFGGISKFLELIVFRQILVVLGSFRQFWADFAALAIWQWLTACPNFG